MSGREKAEPVALGLRAARGGGVLVGIALAEGAPRVVLSSFVATSAENDPLSFEPYHVAAAMKRGPGGEVSAEAAAAVAEGRKRQDKLAANGLAGVIRKLRQERCEPVAAALLVNRAGWISDLLEYSLAFPDHPPVAEGLAVREAFRFAIRKAGLNLAEIDEKSLPETAMESLGLESGEQSVRLSALGASAGRPWRKEQKLACLAAWVTLVKAP